jgi:hypothetical protein
VMCPKGSFAVLPVTGTDRKATAVRWLEATWMRRAGMGSSPNCHCSAEEAWLKAVASDGWVLSAELLQDVIARTASSTEIALIGCVTISVLLGNY